MNRVRPARLAVIAPLLTLAAFTYATPVKTDQVEAELIAEETALLPGQPTTVALLLKIAILWQSLLS